MFKVTVPATSANVGSGFDSIGIALIFTVVSMTRSAIWRWYFRKRRT